MTRTKKEVEIKDGFYIDLEELGYPKNVYFGHFPTKTEAKIFKAFMINSSLHQTTGINLFLKEEVNETIDNREGEFRSIHSIHHSKFPTSQTRGKLTTKILLEIIKDWVVTDRECKFEYDYEKGNNQIEKYRTWKYS